MQLIKTYYFNGSFCNEIRDSNHLFEINGLQRAARDELNYIRSFVPESDVLRHSVQFSCMC